MTRRDSEFFDPQRFGCFRIDDEMLRSASKAVWSAVMSRVAILRADSMPDHSIHYVALCDDFDAMPENYSGDVPRYICIITTRTLHPLDFRTYSARFERRD